MFQDSLIECGIRTDMDESYCIVIILAGVLYFLLRQENRRRDRMRLSEEERDQMAFMDLTDKENPHFRYVL